MILLTRLKLWWFSRSHRKTVLACAGPFVAAKTGFAFPERVGVFKRGEIHQFDQQGYDISVAYNAPPRTAVTVYVYTRGPATKESQTRELQQTTADIFHLNRNGTLSSPKLYPLRRGETTINGALVTIEFPEGFAGRKEPVRTLLLLFPIGDYFVKFRCTYPQNHHESAWADVEALVGTLDWPLVSRPVPSAALS